MSKRCIIPLRPRSSVSLPHPFLQLYIETEDRSHICFELLKNSLRAVVERFGVDNEDQFPPIKVVVVEGSEDITIKISDEGGGIPRSAVPMIWT
jgi:C4-dicarboxylate-specific signal transduction histidine kinase